MKIDLPSHFKIIPCAEGVLLAKCDASGFVSMSADNLFCFANIRSLKKYLRQYELVAIKEEAGNDTTGTD